MTLLLIAKDTRIVTGGSEGIGYALAELYIDHRAKVTLASRSKEKLEDAQRQLQSRNPHAKVLTCPTDVSSHQQVRHIKSHAAAWQVACDNIQHTLFWLCSQTL